MHDPFIRRTLRLVTLITWRYFRTIKLAVSIPDPLFKSAERLARKLKKPRCRLYAEALACYVSAPDPKGITDNLPQVYRRHSSAVDPAIEKAQAEILPDETW